MESAALTLEPRPQTKSIYPAAIWQTTNDAALEQNHTTAADRAYYALRERILDLHYPPGSTIRDTDLMKAFDLGRTPIREALKRLEVEMLVESHHRKGTYIKGINLTDIKHQYQIRRQLISLAAGLSAQFVDNQAITRLQKRLDQIKVQDDKIGIIRGTADLDLQIARATGNRHLIQTLSLYYGYARRTWMLIKDELDKEGFRLEDYQEILFWTRRRNAEKASLLMASHVDCFHLVVVDKYLKRYV